MDPDEWVPICLIAADPKVGQLAEQLLSSPNIPCSWDGTVVYYVRTPRKDAAKASELIGMDAAQKGYWVDWTVSQE